MTSLLRSKKFHSLLGLAVSIGLIIWLIYTVEWSAVGRELVRANYWMLGPSLIVFVLHYYLRALRWKLLLPSETKASVTSLFEAILVGGFATFVLPLRAGEFIRPYMISRQGEIPFSTCFVSVVIERFFDLSMVLLSFAIIVFFIPSMPSWAENGAWGLGCMALGLLAFMLLATLAPASLRGLVLFFVRIIPGRAQELIRKFLLNFLDGAAVLKSATNLGKILLLSVAIWISCHLAYYIFLVVMHIEPSILLAVSISVILALAVAAPSAPGFVGIFQTACIAAFALFGINQEIATGYAIVSHIFQYVFVITFGLAILWRAGIRVGDLASKAQG